MLRQFTTVALLVLAGWSNASNAALLDICDSFSEANNCGPGFNINGTSVNFTYTYNSSNEQGTLSSSGAISDASFLEGQLDAGWVAGNSDKRTSILVTNYSGTADNYDLSITFNKDGSLDNGSLTMNGTIFAYFDGGPQIALSANGTSLTGDLIKNGAIAQVGSDNQNINFIGNMALDSVMSTADYGSIFSGIAAFTPGTITTTSGNIEWDKTWTATGSLGVVVPIPAAVWLFVSGLFGLMAFSRNQKRI